MAETLDRRGKGAKPMTDLSHLARTGAEIAVRVTPGASRNAVTAEGGAIRIRVTAIAEDGKASAAAAKLLARALGIPKTRLTLIRGRRSRDKVFRID